MNLIIRVIDTAIDENTYHLDYYLAERIERDREVLYASRRYWFDPTTLIPGTTTNQNVVVADFALPYMCCSDCSPVNFVVPKEPVQLGLPQSKICFTPGATDAVPFTVKPTDGEVKAVVSDNLNGGVVQDENGQYWFDPNALDPTLYFQSIAFTVNDAPTTATISVVPNPSATVVIQNIAVNNVDQIAEVILKITGQELYPTTTYDWNWDGGIGLVTTPNADGEVRVSYRNLSVGTTTFNPVLNLGNEGCIVTVDVPAIEVTIEAIPTTFELGPYDPCLKNDMTANLVIPYTVSPPNALPETLAPVAGININSNGIEIQRGVFTAFGVPIGFRVNGVAFPSETITIYNESDLAGIVLSPSNHSVVEGQSTPIAINVDVAGLTNQQRSDYSFEWKFPSNVTNNDHLTESGGFTKEFDVSGLSAGEQVLTIALSIFETPCGTIELEGKVKIKVSPGDDDDFDVKSCIEKAPDEMTAIAEMLKFSSGINVPSIIKKEVIVPTRDNLFEKINTDLQLYLSGSKNGELPGLYSITVGDEIVPLVTKTVDHMLFNNNGEDLFQMLGRYLSAQIKLLLLVTRCQKSFQTTIWKL